MYVITTTYKANAKGTGQIVAKGNGKQRTVNFDHSRSVDANHGEAAGTLALALDLPWHDGIEHDSPAPGTHRFAWTPPVLIDLTKQSL